MTSLVNDMDELILKQKHVYMICNYVNSNMFTFDEEEEKEADLSTDDGADNTTVETNDIISK